MRKISLKRRNSDTDSDEEGSVPCHHSNPLELSTTTIYKSEMPSLTSEHRQALLRKLEKCGISFIKESHSPSFCLQMVKTNWESILYEARYGGFTMNITLLKTKLNLLDALNAKISEGQFGKVFYLKETDNEAVIKVSHTFPQHNYNEGVKILLMEIFFAKIASALGVGPDFKPLLGYDAVLEEESLHFCMEFCETIDNKQIQQMMAQ